LNTKLITLSALFITPLLSGCLSDERTIYAICDDNPQICNDVETKGWCKTERALVIRHREREILAPNDHENLFSGLNEWQEFSQCIEIAANIKRRQVKDRDAIKESTFLVTLQEIARIEKETRHSELPEFLYYHWAQDGDQRKIDKLIALDARGKLNTTKRQLMMASFYGKTNKNKAVSTQYKALSLLSSPDLDKLPPSLFASLATHFYQNKNYKLSFVWAQVAVKSGMKANKFNSLQQKLETQQADINKLNALAVATYDSIQALNFIEPDAKI